MQQPQRESSSNQEESNEKTELKITYYKDY